MWGYRAWARSEGGGSSIRTHGAKQWPCAPVGVQLCPAVPTDAVPVLTYVLQADLLSVTPNRMRPFWAIFRTGLREVCIPGAAFHKELRHYELTAGY